MNKTTKTTIASATAAALLVGGVAVYSALDTSPMVQPIDWSLYELNIPSLNVPQITFPTLVADLDVPSINVGADLNSSTGITTFGINNSIGMNNLTSSNQIYVPTLMIDNTILNKLVLNDEKLNLETPSVSTPDKDFPEWMEFIKKISTAFRDTRMANYDKTMLKSNETINDWLKIYDQYKNAQPVNYVAIKKPFKMISQVQVPKNSKQLQLLQKNLIYYKSQGYDSVLVMFTKDDDAYSVLNTIKYIIKYCNMNVWLTYGGSENLNETVFMDVEKYTRILSECAPYITGYINSWRRTSSHLWEQDLAFMNYTNHILRQSNGNLPIIGELYYGNTHKYQHVGNVGFGLNNFKNSSGVMVVNFGFKKIDVKYLIQNVLNKQIGNVAKIALVVGQKPYYMTDNNNKLDYKKNMKIKHEIEKKFLENGCVGTITLSNDGKKMETNNISETPYEKLQGI